MYAYVLHGDTGKKRKARRMYDGRDGVSYGRPSGLSSVRIAKPFIDPLDPANLEPAAPGHRTKRAHFDKIMHTQFPAFEEQARREIAARRAGKHNLTCVFTELTYRLALPMSLQQALADDDGVNDETFDMNLDGNDNDWITASEDDGECDEIISDLRGERRDARIRSAIYFSLVQT